LLQLHITESSRQIGILKDELSSIKSHVTVHCKSVSQQIETVETSTKQIEHLITNSTHTTQKRLQAICDSMKSTLHPVQHHKHSPENERTRASQDIFDMNTSRSASDKATCEHDARDRR